MSSTTESATASKGMLWTGRVISMLVVLFMLFDCITKILKVPQVVDATVKAGFSAGQTATIGYILLFATIVYVIPQSSNLGAILLVGYLGGAVCTQLRVGAPIFENAFPIVFGILTWLGLYLREPRLRALVPFRR
ncbi:MAG TPA: DoxX family protein [Candidatus Acidoferrales bacterium]|jgi:hypothetical protein|nr:DoxX family protein [Candidatus Acidoferrales bacterium]